MSGLILCGKTAERPFMVKDDDISIYSMEELCYYIYNNIYMIGAEFFDESLLEFIESGLGLEKVAKKLKDEMFRQEPYSNMIRTVLDGSSYYSLAEKKALEEQLQEFGKNTDAERRKLRADMLAERGRYHSALSAYRGLLKGNGGAAEAGIMSCIWNNMGVIYAKMFLYEEAEKCFRTACNTGSEQEYMDNLICIVLLRMEENADCGSLEELKQWYNIDDDTIEQYKKAIELAREDVRTRPETEAIMRKLTYSGDIELTEFYGRSDEVINMWKNRYREQMR